MKHFLFIVALVMLGGLGSLYHPFWGVLLYYSLSVLRPQYLWAWSLPEGFRWSLFAALIVLAGCLLNLNKLKEGRRINLIITLMVFYGMWLMLSVLNAYEPELAMNWGIEFGKILLIGAIASIVIRHLWQVRIIAVMILLCLGYVGWEINSLYLFDGRLDIFHSGYGGFDNNGAGLMLAMGVPFAYAFAVASKKRWQRLACWMVAIVLVHAVLMSYSRGAMLGLAVASIWILMHHRPRHHAVIIAVAAVLIVSVLAGEEIRQRFISMEQYENDNSANSRFDSWAAGWAIATSHPLLGVGVRNSNLFTRNFGADRQGRTIHSQYIQIAADAGFPALILYIFIVGLALMYLRRTRWLCRRFLQDHQRRYPDREPDEIISQFVHIALGCEASLFLFAFDGIFLSLEMFELPWLLIILAGLLPSAVQLHLGGLPHGAPKAGSSSKASRSRRRGGAPAQRRHTPARPDGGPAPDRPQPSWA